MKPVYQTIFGAPMGNCLQATTASIFEVNLEEVPNFNNDSGNEWPENWHRWCAERGLFPLYIQANPESYQTNFGAFPGYYEATVRTERGLLHSVVCKGGSVVHDPYPGGSKITEVIGYTVFVSLMGDEIL